MSRKHLQPGPQEATSLVRATCWQSEVLLVLKRWSCHSRGSSCVPALRVPATLAICVCAQRLRQGRSNNPNRRQTSHSDYCMCDVCAVVPAVFRALPATPQTALSARQPRCSAVSKRSTRGAAHACVWPGMEGQRSITMHRCLRSRALGASVVWLLRAFRAFS